MRSLRAIACVVVASVAIVACYDSRWGEGERTAKHNAQYLTPAEISASPASSNAPAIARVFHVRVFATTSYTTQTVDWKSDFKEVLAYANKVLGPGFDVRIDVETSSLWEGSPPEDQLTQALYALRDHDDGKGVEWVVGLVGGLSKFTSSFDQLGLGETPGRYFVMRAATDLKDFDAIDKTLAELSADERTEVVHARRRHRSVALFLHELAHTLGGVHEAKKDLLLYPTYDSSMSTFGPAATDLITASFTHRKDAALTAQEKTSFYDALLTSYEKAAEGDWDGAERDAMVIKLRAVLGKAAPLSTGIAPNAKASTSAAPAPIAAPATMKPADAAIYVQANEQFQAGKYADAWKTAKPLFSAYPDSYDVQDFHCKLAMKQGFDWQTTKAECAALMKLSTTKK
jgi:hypothetical protein